MVRRVGMGSEGFCFRRHLALWLGATAACLGAQVAEAVTDISGTYAGKVTGTETCPPPDGTQSVEEAIALTLTQSGNSVSGSGTGTDRDGEQETFTLSGTVSGSNVSGSFTVTPINGEPPFNGYFNGTFDGNALNLNLSWYGDCTGYGSGTLTRTAGGDLIVDPEVTPSSTLTSSAFLSEEVKGLSTGLGSRVGDVLRGVGAGARFTANGFALGTGLNAGDGGMGMGAWASYSYADFENDFPGTAFDGHRHNVLAGLDIAPWERTVLGVAFGYENGDIDTNFNRGQQETEGFTVAPYFGALLTEVWSIDFSFGYTALDYDQHRTSPGTGQRVSSSPSGHRWFGALNVNGLRTYGNWVLGAKLGALWAESTVEDFVESNGAVVPEVENEVGQWNVGANLAYSFGKFEPFASVLYENDFNMTDIAVVTGPQPANDEDDVLTGVGVRYYGQNGISANLEWNRRLLREDFDEDIVTASVRIDF